MCANVEPRSNGTKSDISSLREKSTIRCDVANHVVTTLCANTCRHTNVTHHTLTFSCATSAIRTITAGCAYFVYRVVRAF